VPCFSAFFDEHPPFKHDVFGDLKNPSFEHGPDFMGKPIMESRPSIRVTIQIDAESDFSKRDDAYGELDKWARGYKSHDRRVRIWPTQLRKNVCIQQPSH